MNLPTAAIAKYGTRYWAVYQGEELICVTVYKRGALEVAQRLSPLRDESTIQPTGQRQSGATGA